MLIDYTAGIILKFFESLTEKLKLNFSRWLCGFKFRAELQEVTFSDLSHQIVHQGHLVVSFALSDAFQEVNAESLAVLGALVQVVGYLQKQRENFVQTRVISDRCHSLLLILEKLVKVNKSKVEFLFERETLQSAFGPWDFHQLEAELIDRCELLNAA